MSDELDEFERQLLRAGRAETPSAEARHRVLLPALSAPLGALAIPGAVRDALLKWSSIKVGLVSLSAGALIVVAVAQGRAHPPAARAAAAQPTKAVEVGATVEPVLVQGFEPPVIRPSLEPGEAPAPKAGARVRPRLAPVDTEASDAPPSGAAPTTLAEELALLEHARVAMLAGQWTSTLEALEEHRSRFPSAQLAPERDALLVEALFAAGRNREAEAQARAFLQEFAGSPQAGRVKASLVEHEAGRSP